MSIFFEIGLDKFAVLYDLDGTVCGLKHNGIAYYFYKNLQGDIIAISNDTGATIARYTYDAWGKCTIVSDTSGVGIATINPFRYRSYYYDAETSLYYLQSRYYNPEVGRFINADGSENFCSTHSILSNNAFCYCENNPVNETDDQGALFVQVLKILGKMAMGALTGALMQFLTDIVLTVMAGKAKVSTTGVYVEAACSGAFDAVLNIGLVGSIISAVVFNALGQIVDLIRGKKKSFNMGDLIIAILDSCVTYFLMKKLKIKEPNYIRDIKKEARGLGVKGKKNLDAYLKAKLKLIKKHNRIMNLMKVAFNVAREFVVGFLEMIFDWFVALAQYIKKTVNLRNRKYQYA